MKTSASIDNAQAPLIAHVIHELGVGGLENGLVNLINRMPPQRFRHAVICLTGYTEFRKRIHRQDVGIFAMARDSAPLARTYWKLFRLLRSLRPALVHTRNLSGLDALLPAFLAGVPVRVHGEHGRDIGDLDGSNRKYRRLRKMMRPLVTHYTAVSKDLAEYLVGPIGVPQQHVSQIYNGVDTLRFKPPVVRAGLTEISIHQSGRQFVVGTVGRLQPVKDQVLLVRAFDEALRTAPELLSAAKLVIAGEGPSRSAIEAAVASAGLQMRVELLGQRDDVAAILSAMDVFVLPSLAEGISNTILEAMATRVPVIATCVGGNADLVENGVSGYLVRAGDYRSIAERIVTYAGDEELRRKHGLAARERVERHYSLETMVSEYGDLYDRLINVRSSERQFSAIRDS